MVNIGPRERRKRFLTGLVALGGGAAVALGLVLSGADRWWRLALLVPFWVGALGVFQAREKT